MCDGKFRVSRVTELCLATATSDTAVTPRKNTQDDR